MTLNYERVDVAALPKRPRRATAEQARYDAAIAATATGPIAIVIAPEQDERSVRRRLSHAARRAEVKVRAWYDPGTVRVYAERIP